MSIESNDSLKTNKSKPVRILFPRGASSEEIARTIRETAVKMEEEWKKRQETKG